MRAEKLTTDNRNQQPTTGSCWQLGAGRSELTATSELPVRTFRLSVKVVG